VAAKAVRRRWHRPDEPATASERSTAMTMTIEPSPVTQSFAPMPGTFDPRDLPWAAMHRGMRRDAPRLQRAIAETRTVNRERPEQLVQWYARFDEALHHHHVLEDEVIWPLLRRIDPRLDDELAGLEAEHGELSARLDALDHALDAWAGAPSAHDWMDARRVTLDASAALVTTLSAHLDREDASIFPIVANFTSEQRTEMETGIKAHDDKHLLAFVAPFVLAGVRDDEMPALRAQVPKVMFVMNKLLWQRSYNRLAAIIEGA
jgi:hemerythrin-like domain-containing protein